MHHYAIIPARYASSRLPGKPLLNIAGKPMFWHVYTRACQCSLFDQVILATDHELIAQKATELQVPYVLTSPDHPSGTDRCYEVAKTLAQPQDIIVNIQGDEPLLEPQMLYELLQPFSQNSKTQVATLGRVISHTEANSPHVVKIALTQNNQALYFSRSLIPFHRDQDPATTTYTGHVGLYAFTMQALTRFVSTPPSALEQLEKLEQLRFLELDIPIQVTLTSLYTQGVDTPADLLLVKNVFKNCT